MSKTFDLTTLNLSAGTHEITVKARASGYMDSPASNAVSYVVAGDTVQVSGSWYFNLVPSISSIQNVDYFESVSFVSNGVSFKNLLVTHKGYYIRCMPTNGEKGDEIYIYDNDTGWLDQAYRTITFDGVQTVSKEFYEWLVANAKRPISGTWKFNTSPLPTDKTLRQTVNFNSNGDSYTEIYLFYHQVPAFVEFQIQFLGKVGSSGTDSKDNVYQYNSTDSDATFWQNQAYRTVEFVDTQYVTQDFYEWFTSNAVFAFTIDGTTYYAKEGMTWGEWVESEYNTGVEEGGTIIKYFVDIYGGSYIVGTNEEIPIGAILRSSHGGGVGYVVRLNGVCVLNTDTIMPTAYEEVKAGRD